MNIVKAMLDNKAVISMAEGRRAIAGNAVKVNGATCFSQELEVHAGDRIEVGKRKVFIVADSDITPLSHPSSSPSSPYLPLKESVSYKLRNGMKVMVTAFLPDFAPFTGEKIHRPVIAIADPQYIPSSLSISPMNFRFTLNGKYRSDRTESQFDIVGEWVEPVELEVYLVLLQHEASTNSGNPLFRVDVLTTKDWSDVKVGNIIFSGSPSRIIAVEGPFKISGTPFTKEELIATTRNKQTIHRPA